MRPVNHLPPRPGAAFAERFPDLAAQWHPTRNGDLTPADVGFAAGGFFWWRCDRGHDFYATLPQRRQMSAWKRDDRAACPECIRPNLRRYVIYRCGHGANVKRWTGEVQAAGDRDCPTCTKSRPSNSSSVVSEP